MAHSSMARRAAVPHRSQCVRAGRLQATLRVLAVVWLALSTTLLAQAATAREHGSLVGTVFAPDGSCMASAQVRLAGPQGAVVALADVGGRFRFPSLEPGSYALEVRQDDEVVARYQPVVVRLGRPTSLEVRVRSDPDATLVVMSEPPEPALQPATAPRLDAEAVGQVAADRDPFRAAQSAGIEVRADEPGRPGDPGGDETWRLDGVRLAEPPSVPLPSGVRLQVLSSADAARGSAEPVIDLLSPSAPGRGRGEIHFGLSDRSWNRAPALSQADLLEERLVSVLDAGIEGGLDLVAERLWAWGSWQVEDVTRRALGGQETRTDGSHLALKLQAQLHPSASLVLGHSASDRRTDGEGAGLDRSLEATGLELAPGELSSLSSALVLGSRVAFDLQYAEARDAASLLPRSPLAGSGIVLDSSGIWRGGIAELHHREDRQQLSLRGDASFRRSDSPLRLFDHRLRFGYQELDSATSDLERWGADNLQFIAGENLGTPFDLVRARRSGELEVNRRFRAFWLQDTLGRDRLSIDLGVRLDRQAGWAGSGMLEAHTLVPELLPALEYDGRGSALEWVDLSPRLGLAWALTRDHDTILRLSRSSFASQLDRGLVGRVSPLAGGEVLLALGGAHFVPGQGSPATGPQPGFTIPNPDDDVAPFGVLRLVGSQSHDVFDPRGQANALASNLRSERIDELGLRLEHHVGRVTEISLDFTEQLVSNMLERRLYVREADGQVRVALNHDYRLETVATGSLPDGSPYAVPVYGLAEGLTYTGGSLVDNGDRRHLRRQLGLGVHRRLSNGFQARGHVSWTERRWLLGSDFVQFDDPTDEIAEVDGAGISSADGAGDESALGRRGDGRWSFDVSAMVQVAQRRAWGFDLAASVHGREGYRIDYFVDSVSDRTRRLDVTAGAAGGGYRLDDVLTVDLRLQKDLRLGRGGGAFDASLALDVFNLLDAGVVLERETSLTAPTAGDVRRTLSPRVFQLGVRLALP